MSENQENQIIETSQFSQWYLEVLKQAELVDYAPVRGCMVIRPYGFAIWELLSDELDKRLKKAGIKNAYFPLFIPESFLNKEKDHLEGFSPELAVVTHAGGEKLAEPLVVRPTSETIIYHMFSKWIKSYRDLPLKINQWANVVRWEMRTRPFLRTSEFLWQEGHTAHETEEEARQTAEKHLDLYVNFLKDFLAIPVISGKKTDSEKFAGAKITFTMEPIMRDGKALQVGTSHLLDHNFPKAFEVEFQNREGSLSTPWCTSWGVTTRLIGALIMVHGDLDSGLVLPPKVAPYQVSVVPIRRSGEDSALVDNYLSKIKSLLENSDIRYTVFDDERTPGARFFASEQQGIPLRIEFGMRDIATEQVVLNPRLVDESFNLKKKQLVKLEDLSSTCQLILNNFQEYLYKRAEAFLLSNQNSVVTLEELTQGLNNKPGFYTVHWCREKACEILLKELSASFRVVLDEQSQGSCFGCAKQSTMKVIVAKSY